MTTRARPQRVPKTFESWRREVDGIQRFLSQAPLSEKNEGKAWVGKMMAYYRERLTVLVKNHPRLPKGYKLPKIP